MSFLFCSSIRLQTNSVLVTGVQTCALPIYSVACGMSHATYHNASKRRDIDEDNPTKKLVRPNSTNRHVRRRRSALMTVCVSVGFAIYPLTLRCRFTSTQIGTRISPNI